MPVKLPTGPPKITLGVRFTARELEFIQLRFGKCLSLKEIASAWGVTLRVIAHHSENVGVKLGLRNKETTGTFLIAATKRLIKFGFITADGGHE